MNVGIRRLRVSVRSLLLAVLLLAQGQLLAHEVDHIAASDAGFCAVCQIGHGLDSPAVHTCLPPPAVSDHAAPFARSAQPRLERYPQARRARAPPYSLFA